MICNNTLSVTEVTILKKWQLILILFKMICFFFCFCVFSFPLSLVYAKYQCCNTVFTAAILKFYRTDKYLNKGCLEIRWHWATPISADIYLNFLLPGRNTWETVFGNGLSISYKLLQRMIWSKSLGFHFNFFFTF